MKKYNAELKSFNHELNELCELRKSFAVSMTCIRKSIIR